MYKIKNKKTIIILSILLIGLIGITIAYFTNTVDIENIFKTKPYGTIVTEEFISPDSWLPGDETPKTIKATNTGEVDQAVRISYTEKWITDSGIELNGWIHADGSKSSHTTEEELNSDERAAIINFDNTDDWTYNDGYYYYNYRLKPNETTSSLIKSVTFNSKTKLDDTCEEVNNNGVKTITCNSSEEGYDGATYTLTFTIETVQFNKYMEAWSTNVEIASEPTLFCDYFEVGELVTYNGVDYYVLNYSSNSDDYVTLLKKEPLTAEEVNQYSDSYVSQDGEYPYYTSDTCNENIQTGCSTNYNTSDVKKILDSWSSSFSDDLIEENGYKIRLIEENELDFSITDDFFCGQPMTLINFDEDTPKFIKLNDGHSYWTLIPMNDSNNNVVVIGSNNAKEYNVYNEIYIRPVINVKKNVLEGVCSLKSVHFACYFGDSVTYNSSEYYVIDDSDAEQKYVTLLKEEPLTADEVNQYSDSYRSQDGEYPFCLEDRECIRDDFGHYNYSDLRKIVDQWASSFHSNLVGIDDYKARLLKKDELFDKFGYTFQGYPFGYSYPHSGYLITLNTPNWVYNIDKYWSMVDYYNGNDVVYSVSEELNYENLNNKLLVRPVINLNKKAIENGCHNNNNSNKDQQVDGCDIDEFNHVSYSIGDIISYNGSSYYVIYDSDAYFNHVILLKAEPLTYEELSEYNNGYDIQNDNGIGIMPYYKSDDCYYNNDNDYNSRGCKFNYASSNIKDVINNWSKSMENDLISTGILDASGLRNLGYEYDRIFDTQYGYFKSSDTPEWVYNSNYSYWIYYENRNQGIINNSGQINEIASYYYSAVRPVIDLKKCAISN